MLAILMYHRAGTGKHSNSPKVLRRHFSFLAQNYPIILPGDPLEQGRLNICLTFDDATFDFYHFVFPILREMKLRALLGIPVKFILSKTSLNTHARLSIPYYEAMKENTFQKYAPFCTWEELREMVSSGYVQAASHSYTHQNLTFPTVDLSLEISKSKKILQNNLQQAISSFIYPFGQANQNVHQLVKKHYLYSMRIGEGLNWNWRPSSQMLYRINADNIDNVKQRLSFKKLCAAGIKTFCKHRLHLI